MKKLFSVLLCGAMLVGFSACEKNELSKESEGTHKGHEYVDLGLLSGTLWATCNIGAIIPEGRGNYFAWGETKPKTDYIWKTYKYFSGDWNDADNGITKYDDTDKKTTLEAADDAASANWGGDWRMPTVLEFEELLNSCVWTWTTVNDVNGYRVTGPNGNHIFLPATGSRYGSNLNWAEEEGCYWSSSLGEYTSTAYTLYFQSDFTEIFDWEDGRCEGLAVRPVCSSK